MTYIIHSVEYPKTEDVQFLCDRLSENAQVKKNHKLISLFGFFIRDEHQEIVGGCNGDIIYGSVYVSQLWISEKLRAQGYGSKLMKLAEKRAIDEDCNFISVNTFDWEALDFYKKLGFYVEFERHGFDKNSIFYFLRKDLKT